jgi:hypothetical protein
MKLDEIKPLNEGFSYEIFTFGPKQTGLQTPVWLCDVNRPDPVLTVSNVSQVNLTNNFQISVSKKPKLLTPSKKAEGVDLEKVLKFVRLNYDVLMEFFQNYQTGAGSMIATNKKIKHVSTIMEMANLQPADTGIDRVIWIGKGGNHSSLRIKVSNLKGKPPGITYD